MKQKNSFVDLKQIRQTTQSRRLEQHMALAKVSL